MLSFLRNHQRIFFVLIAIFVIITFSFFGIERAVQDIRQVEDTDIGLAVNRSKMKLSEVENMSKFILSDSGDSNMSANDYPPNFFNDGVIKKDFFETGLAALIAEQYFDKIELDLRKSFDKVKRFSPFTHYDIPIISAVSVWEKFNPELNTKFNDLKKFSEINNDYFAALIELYQAQMKFPPEILRRVLIYQERQYPNGPSDSRLYQNDLALFGFKNSYEWFGKNFVDAVSQFIINVAIVAQEKGYNVTYHEAMSDLVKNLSQSLKDQNIKGDPTTYFKRQLQMLGLDEKSAVKTWQKVLTFRRYFHDVSNNIFMDQHSYKEFAKFALQAAQIKLYKLPDSLHLNNFEDLVDLQVYLDVTCKDNDYEALPNEFLSVDEIEHKYPELVEQKFLVDLSETTIDEVALAVTIKEMTKWQLDDKNWNMLCKKFSKLKKANSQETRYNQLEKLDKEAKYQVDSFSRIEIANQNPKWIEDNLNFIKPQRTIFGMRQKGTVLPIANLKNQQELIELIKSNDEIAKYTVDNKTFYKIRVVEKPNEKYLISYKNAKEDNTLQNLSSAYLNQKYLDIRAKYPITFKNADGSFKRYKDAKKDVINIIFADLLKNIDKHLSKKSKDLDGYALGFLSMHMNSIKTKLMENKLKMDDLADQWKVIEKEKEIIRSKEKDWIQNQLFTMPKDSFSDVQFVEDSNPQFFHVMEFNEKVPSYEKIEKSKEGMKNESKCLLAKKLIKQFFENNNIVLPTRPEKIE